MRRSVVVISGLGLAATLTLWTGLFADGQPASVASGGESKEQSRHPPIAFDDGRMPSTETTAATPISTPPAPVSVLPAAATGPAIPITVLIPQKVFVGEMNDLTVGVGTNAGLSEIGFTVRFDPNVLQVRAGTQGSWAVAIGANPRFAAEISETDDRVQIRSVVPSQRAGMTGGNVATVQFQAVTTGTTTVLITDVVVKDSSGRSVVPAVSAANVQVTVDSVPPSTSAVRRQAPPQAPNLTE